MVGLEIRYLVWHPGTGRGYLESDWPFRLHYLELPINAQCWYPLDESRDVCRMWANGPGARELGVWNARGQGHRSDMVRTR